MVSVDRVYQTVQKILNKEQRGYLPPIEFNLFANMAQIEIFENYFYDMDAYLAGGMNDSDYADIARNLEEKITFFDNTSAPITENSSDVFPYPANFYRLGRVTLNNIIADEVSHKDAAYVNLSPLTAPTRKQPIYVRHEGGIVLYPSLLMDTDQVRMIYTRRPATVNWTYINVMGRAMYNANAEDAQDFELHPSELTTLVLKICALAGVAVRALDVTQAIQGEEASLVAEQKQ